MVPQQPGVEKKQVLLLQCPLRVKYTGFMCTPSTHLPTFLPYYATLKISVTPQPSVGQLWREQGDDYSTGALSFSVRSKVRTGIWYHYKLLIPYRPIQSLTAWRCPCFFVWAPVWLTCSSGLSNWVIWRTKSVKEIAITTNCRIFC